MTNESSVLLVEHTGPVVRVTLNRPSSANTINVAMANQFRDIIAGLDDEVRVVVLAASGSVFCGGGDMREVLATDDREVQVERLANALNEVLLALEASNAVTIAEIGGATAGAGLGLALHADLIVASEKARFLTAYERLAVTPDCGVSDLLPRTIGLHRALQMSILGREIDAHTALLWGLVAEVVPQVDLTAHVTALADQIAVGSGPYLAQTGRLYRAIESDHARRLDVEARGIAASIATPLAGERLERFRRST